MNKLTKASIAGAAGIALLLGGAGSLAYWNDSASVSGANIESGSLSVSATGTWDNTIAKWVPGDTATYTGSITVVAVGDNFKGELTLNESSISGDAQLIAALTRTLAITGAPITGVTGPVADVYTITGPGTYTIPVTVTVNFPYGTTIDNATQSQSVDLTGISFNVKQVTP